MALSKPGLKTRIITELVAQGFIVIGPHATFTSKYAEAVANAVVDEIQANARCSGTDLPMGDSHDNVRIV